MNRRIAAGLSVVAACAAVLSFSAIRDLALLCGFAPSLAWLLPVCVDVGAAVATALWLATDAPQAARDYARALALALLVSSVAANGLSHGLAAYRLNPPWWVVVLVSAVPAGVLGAVVHLVVLARPAPAAPVTEPAAAAPAPVVVEPTPPPAPTPEPATDPLPDRYDEAVAESVRLRREGGNRFGATALRKTFGLSEWRAKEAAKEAAELVAQPVRAVNG